MKLPCFKISFKWSHSLVSTTNLENVSLRKSKIGFINPRESENGFCVTLLNRLSKITWIVVHQRNRMDSSRFLFLAL